MIVQLMWKECREHVGKMLCIAGILLPLMWIGSRTNSLGWQDIADGAWLWSVWLTPVWLATITISAEKARRTTSTFAALPVRRWVVFAIKTFCAVAAFEVPLGLALWLGCGSLFIGPEVSEYIGLMMGGLALYGLILCVGLNIAREGMAAMVGVLVLLICGIWLVVVVEWFRGVSSSEKFIPWLLALDPFGICYAMTGPKNGPWFPYLALAVQAAAYWGLAGWRYSLGTMRVGAKSERGLSPDNTSWPIVEKRFRGGALIWKERREQLALLITTAVIGGGIAILLTVIQTRSAGYAGNSEAISVHDILAMFFVIGTYLPTIVAAILGIAAMTGDLDAPIVTFWQSRPIAAKHLFWTKYFFALLGVVVLEAFFEAPYFIAMSLLKASHWSNSVVNLEFRPASLVMGQLFWLPLTLSVAFFFAAVFRRAIYAVVVVVVSMALVLTCPLIQGVSVGSMLFDERLPQLFLPVVLTMGALAVVFAILARVAFARRWRIG